MNTRFERTKRTKPTPVQQPITVGDVIVKAGYKPSRIAIAGPLIVVYLDKPAGLNQPILQSRFKSTPLTCVSFGWTSADGHYFTLQLKPGVQVL